MVGSAPCAPDCLCGRHFAKRHKCNPGCTCRKHLNGPWTGDRATYQAKHKRLHKIRGSAEDLPCVECGKCNSEWSQKSGTDGLDVYEHYEPRCRLHHHNYDKEFHPHGPNGDFI